MRTEETDLVIVGGGFPALMMATEGSRRGLRARVLEQPLAAGDRTAADTNAVVLLQPAALESLARLEIFDDVRRPGAVIEGVRLYAAGASEPAVRLSYSGVQSPFPFAVALSWEALRPVLIRTFERYGAIFLEPETQLLSLDRRHGRVSGAVGRDGAGEVKFSAHVIVSTTAQSEALRRIEADDMTGARSYGEELARFMVERPDDYPSDRSTWLDSALAVTATPVGPEMVEVQVVAPASTLRGAIDGGADGLRRLLVPTAPSLEGALKSLDGKPDVTLSALAHGVARAWSGDGRLSIGPSAHVMSPLAGMNDTQAALDGAAVAGVLSRSTYSNDYSRVALRGVEVERQNGIALARTLTHDFHRLAVARSGLYKRGREAFLNRLAASPSQQARVIRAIAGYPDDRFTFADRLRLGGFLGMKPEAASEG